MAVKVKKDETAEKLLTAIRNHCMDCSNGSRTEVRNCRQKKCNLYPYRMKGTEKEE